MLCLQPILIDHLIHQLIREWKTRHPDKTAAIDKLQQRPLAPARTTHAATCSLPTLTKRLATANPNHVSLFYHACLKRAVFALMRFVAQTFADNPHADICYQGKLLHLDSAYDISQGAEINILTVTLQLHDT